MTRGARIALRVAGAACLVVGLWPDYAKVPSSGGATTDLRLGLPSSPAYWYHREPFFSADGVTMFGEDARIRASSVSGYRSEWHVRVFSWSVGFVVAGVVLPIVSLRRRRR